MAIDVRRFGALDVELWSPGRNACSGTWGMRLERLGPVAEQAAVVVLAGNEALGETYGHNVESSARDFGGGGPASAAEVKQRRSDRLRCCAATVSCCEPC